MLAKPTDCGSPSVLSPLWLWSFLSSFLLFLLKLSLALVNVWVYYPKSFPLVTLAAATCSHSVAQSHAGPSLVPRSRYFFLRFSRQMEV